MGNETSGKWRGQTYYVLTDLLCADLLLISYSKQVALVLEPAPLELSCVHCDYMCFTEEETEPWGSNLSRLTLLLTAKGRLGATSP